MNLMDFPLCCGAKILCGFGINSFDDKTFIKNVKNNLFDAHGGIIFGITNIEQIREGKLLTKCGFKKIKTFPNPNTGLSELTLWSYDKTNLPQRFISKIISPLYRLISWFDKRRERRRIRALGW